MYAFLFLSFDFLFCLSDYPHSIIYILIMQYFRIQNLLYFLQHKDFYICYYMHFYMLYILQRLNTFLLFSSLFYRSITIGFLLLLLFHSLIFILLFYFFFPPSASILRLFPFSILLFFMKLHIFSTSIDLS